MMKLSIVSAVGALCLASQARADDAYPTTTTDTDTSTPGTYSYAWTEPAMQSQIGVGVSIGGGISGFTDSGMRDVMKNNLDGLWDLRVSLGTHIPIGLDISYLGTAGSLQSLTGVDNGTLIGTTIEGAIRYNILPHFAWNPYVFAGIGWQRYDVRNMQLAVSDTGLTDTDNVMEFPVGAGISYRDRTGFVADVRGTLRTTASSTLLLEPSGEHASLDWWEASAAIGYEF